MKLSIVMPAYNVEQYIDSAIQSVLSNRSKYDYELIIIDDQSTDATWDIISRYKDNERVQAYRVNHRGLGAARNFGVSLCKGEFVSFIDSDDYITNDYVDTILSTVIRNNVDLLIFKWQQEVNGNVGHEYGTVDLLGMSIACWNKCYKRSLIMEQKFPENVFFEDSGFSLRARLAANKVGFLNKVLYYHRHTEKSISRSSLSLYNHLGCLRGIDDVLQYGKNTINNDATWFLINILFMNVFKGFLHDKTISQKNFRILRTFVRKHNLDNIPLSVKRLRWAKVKLFMWSIKNGRRLLTIWLLWTYVFGYGMSSTMKKFVKRTGA